VGDGHGRRVGDHRGQPHRPRSAPARSRWASTAPRCTSAACCSSATAAAWSTRSTARASRTRWRRRAGRRGRRRALTDQAHRDLDRYDHELRQRWGGYYTLGKVFAELVGNPTVMHVCTTYGMPYRPLMELVLQAHGAPDRRASRRHQGRDHQHPAAPGARRLTARAPRPRPPSPCGSRARPPLPLPRPCEPRPGTVARLVRHRTSRARDRPTPTDPDLPRTQRRRRPCCPSTCRSCCCSAWPSRSRSARWRQQPGRPARAQPDQARGLRVRQRAARRRQATPGSRSSSTWSRCCS
jgi:hypothetical protein